MSGFKLLAIRALEGTSAKFLKNLIPGVLYKFSNEFNYYDIDGIEILNENKNLKNNLEKIEYKEHLSSNFFNQNSNLNINISAIVGKNGSGKSAIFQLLYVTYYSLILKYNISLSDTDRPGKIDLANDPNYPFDSVIEEVNLELIYLDKNYLIIYRIVNKKLTFSVSKKSKFENKIVFADFKQDKFDSTYDINSFEKYENLSVVLKYQELAFSLANFFYTIGINYSIHGLNSKDNGWLDQLFHKNDGYQTPVVINPYRYEGQMDINNEYHLTQSRILLNAEIRNSSEIIDGKRIHEIDFIFDPNRLLKIETTPLKMCLDEIIIKNKVSKDIFFDIFCKIYEGYTGEKFGNFSFKYKFLKTLFQEENEFETFEKKDIQYEDLEAYIAKYVIYKILKLTIKDRKLNSMFGSRYLKIVGDPITGEDYQIFTFYLTNSFNINLIDEILKIDSHLTLKLRQAIFTLKNRSFEHKKIARIIGESAIDVRAKVSFKFFEFKKVLKTWRNISNTKDELNLIPLSFSKVELKVKYKKQNGYHFTELSSGEQQIITTLNTIYYHLFNLNTVHNSQGKVAYRNICILIDEIELYLHPEYQRRFISILLKSLKSIKSKNIKAVDILFSTHSPFILSDIPTSNILRLEIDENGYSKIKSNDLETFGANIHDLLANDFFLNEGFIGEFAKEKIQDVIYNLQMDKNFVPAKRLQKEEIQQTIKLIGEPFLRDKLMEMYKQKYKETNLYEIEIEKLKSKLENYEKLKNK